MDKISKLGFDFDVKIDKPKSSLKLNILITAKALKLLLWKFGMVDYGIHENKNNTGGQIKNRHSKKFEVVFSPCSKMKF